MPFYTVKNNIKIKKIIIISISVERSNITLVIFKAAFHFNPGAVKKQTGSSSYIARYILVLQYIC